MPIESKALVEEGTPRYLASGDPDLADYYPAWLDNIADDATVEGSMLMAPCKARRVFGRS